MCVCVCALITCVCLFVVFTAINIKIGQHQFTHIHHTYWKGKRDKRMNGKETEMETVTVFQPCMIRFFCVCVVLLDFIWKVARLSDIPYVTRIQLYVIQALMLSIHWMEWQAKKNNANNNRTKHQHASATVILHFILKCDTKQMCCYCPLEFFLSVFFFVFSVSSPFFCMYVWFCVYLF